MSTHASLADLVARARGLRSLCDPQCDGRCSECPETVVDELIAAVEGSAPTFAWRPIRTAPKTRPILVLRHQRVYVARWIKEWKCWGVSVEEASGLESSFSDISARKVGAVEVFPGPTHWAECPETTL